MNLIKARKTVAVCKSCGSMDVTSDAVARWNYVRQRWELSSLLQNEDCENCGGETTIVFRRRIVSVPA